MFTRISYQTSSDWRPFVQRVQSEISSDGVVIIEDLYDDHNYSHLLRLARSLGRVELDDTSAPDNPHSYIRDVEAQETPSQDSRGFQIRSTTTLEFPCHTDDYFRECPSDIVMLYCVQHDPQGGDSILVYLSDIVTKLEADVIVELKKPLFPSHCGLVAILTEADEWSIRYNRTELESTCQLRATSLTPAQISALNQLDQAIEPGKHYVKLMPNECMLLHNKKVLHGRTAFSQTSNRLLKRVKVYS